MDSHVSLRGIGKSFGGVRALDDVSFDIAEGSIHCLIGENGAGKSTLGKIIAGAVTPDQGELSVRGAVVHFRTPHDALAHGHTIIAQELALVPTRSVLDNVFLGRERRRAGVVNGRAQALAYRELSDRVGFHLPPGVLVGELRPAQQMEVEVLRAVARGANLIVFDEPTAALTIDEAQVLFDLIRSLQREGTTIVYVSHRMEEILALGDAVTVMKDGRHVLTRAAADLDPDTMIEAMLGRSIDLVFPPKRFVPSAAPVVADVQGVNRGGVLSDVSLQVRAGEIVGLAGLVGSGRSELARTIFGADRADTASITIDGRVVNPRHPRQAIRAGVAMLPESRKTQGLLMQRSIRENVTTAHLGEVSARGLIRSGRERTLVGRLTKRLDVRAPNTRVPVADLSGGNQQKVLFSRWLLRRPRLLIVDEPTHGVDVGAKQQIYQLITELAAEGMAVLVISSELGEVLGLSHRILVMSRGRIAAELGPDATEDEVLRAAFESTRAGGAGPAERTPA